MSVYNERLAEEARKAPDSPGVYIFKDKRERVLYIGKAKNLRNRLKSYFQPSAKLDPRRQSMIKKAESLSFIVTHTELEALALEANLIKQNRPRYNILLRDDKNYPYLRLSKKEPWPTVEVVRRIKKDGALYFGPFIPGSAVWDTLAFIRRHFQIRPCRYNLERVKRPCVQYQMKRCPAPCAGKISRKEYMEHVKEVERFLKGEKQALIRSLEERMYRLSEELRFEEAAKIRDRLNAIKRAFDSQKVVSPELGNTDIIGLYQHGKHSMINILIVRKGLMIGKKDFFLKNTGGLDPSEILSDVIKFYYSKEMVYPAKIILSSPPEDKEILQNWIKQRAGHAVWIRKPRRAIERQLLDMAEDNAAVQMKNYAEPSYQEALKELKERLSLSRVPESIGAFDVSTTFGTQSTGAFVWWEGGEFVKSRYRHLRIKSVEGIDDYSMMQETIKRVTGSLDNLPDLVVIDGGRGHLEVALRAFDEVLDKDTEIDIIAVAKDPDRAVLKKGAEVLLDDGGHASLLLIKIRDEVHRFAISFHRKLRDRAFMKSPLEGIKGIGKKRRLNLLKHFGSVEAIRRASVEEIASVKGMNRKVAELLKRQLNSDD